MANNVTAYGRQQVEWPDLGSDPGVTLHGQIVAAVEYLSNNITGRWSGSVAFSIGQTIQIEHNFGTALANLKVVIAESGVVLSQAQIASTVTIAQVDTNTISVTNAAGVPKTLQVYVYPHSANIRAEDIDPNIDLSTTGSLSFQETLSAQQSSNTQTGLGVTLTAPQTMHVVLNGSGLSSVAGITAPGGSLGHIAIITNATGGVVSFANDSGTAANRLLTGTGADLQLENNASLLVKYDTVASKWRVIGSTGGGSLALTVEQGHAFVVGNPIYFDGTSYVLSKADTSVTAEVLGIVSKVIDSDTFQFIPMGEISGLSGLTPGATYFLSATIEGQITATEPNTIGHVSVPVGTAISATKLLVDIKRGYVIGGANARTQVALANNTSTVIQNAGIYDAGELAGWIEIAATTPKKFYFEAKFAKNGAASDYNISPFYVGDTPPLGFAITVSTGGAISVTLPNVAGFTSAYANFALNAPAVGTNFPLTLNQSAVTANYRAVTGTDFIVETDYFVSASGATDYTLTLPFASAVGGKVFVVKSRLDATKILTIARRGSDTIDGATSVTLFRFESVQLFSNGTNWEIF